jgi:hypothetical protein
MVEAMLTEDKRWLRIALELTAAATILHGHVLFHLGGCGVVRSVRSILPRRR